MKSSESPNSIESNSAGKVSAAVIVLLQLFAWYLAVSYFFGDYTGSGPSSSGIQKGYTLILITFPSMAFIFFSNIYLALKKSLNAFYRFVSVINVFGLILLATNIPWN